MYHNNVTIYFFHWLFKIKTLESPNNKSKISNQQINLDSKSIKVINPKENFINVITNKINKSVFIF